MERKKRSVVWKISSRDLQHLLNTCDSYSDVMRHLGLNPRNGSVKTLYARIKKENLDVSNISKRKWAKFKPKLDDSKIFTKDSAVARNTVKRRLIDDGLIDYVCYECGNKGEHNGKDLSLQLDHVNGVFNDNRLENLRFLCPNCHSQTKSYAGKQRQSKCKCGNKKHRSSTVCRECKGKNDRKVIDRPNLKQLQKEVQELGYCGVGRKYGVSDNAIRKWLDKLTLLI